MTYRLLLSVTALTLTSCAWDPPINPNPLSAVPRTNEVRGNVIFGGSETPGTVYVTVYAANNPGPPLGTGGPVTFATIPADHFTGAGAGLQSAAFVVSGLPDGSYYMNALMDMDNDFSPFVSGMAGATCGDWVGTHLQDLSSSAPALVTVQGNQLLDEVTVIVGAPITTERPAFMVVDTPVMSRAKGKKSILPDGTPDPANTQLYQLKAIPVATAYGPESPLSLEGPCPIEADLAQSVCDKSVACPCAAESPPCQTSFQVYMVDADADGVIDPYPAELQASAGIHDVWPRVYIEYVGEELGTFTHQGTELPERWVGENFPLAYDIALAETLGIPVDEWIGGPIGVPFATQNLTVTFSPAFRHYNKNGAYAVDANGPYDLVDLRDPNVTESDIPGGAWKITVISHTGQTWAVPNEIAGNALPSLIEGFDVATQGVGITLD